MSLIIKLTIFVFLSSTPIINRYQEKNKMDDEALAKVKALPEVKKFFLQAKTHKPALLIAGKPDLKTKYYWIKVGVNNMDMFRTTYDFCVDPNTDSIFYFDMLVDNGDSSGALLTLKEWRHWRISDDFYKMHYYKAGKLIVQKRNR